MVAKQRLRVSAPHRAFALKWLSIRPLQIIKFFDFAVRVNNFVIHKITLVVGMPVFQILEPI